VVLNKWYQSTFFGQENGQFFFLFCKFSKEEEKRGHVTIRSIPVYFEKNLKNWLYINSSQKKNQFKKKNPNWSSGGQDIS
jgi:hypothetical protein